MISDRLQSQIDALKAIPDKVISDVDGYRQTVEDPESLIMDPENAMTHPIENLEAIGKSVNAFGFRKGAACVKEGTRVIYAGNGIVQWCIDNDVPVVPVVWIPESVSDTEAKAFALADNQSSRLGEWDFEQMRETLDEISVGFSPDDLGFDPNEIADAFSQLEEIEDIVVSTRKPKEAEKSEQGSGLVKLLFLPSELSVVEKAIREANQPSRGEALTLICKTYLSGAGGE